MRYEVGDKLFILSEKQPYTVMARNDRVFSKDYKNTEDCNARLKELQENIDEVIVSFRNFVQLDIDVA